MEVFEEYLAKIENEAHRFRMREVLAWVKDTFRRWQRKSPGTNRCLPTADVYHWVQRRQGAFRRLAGGAGNGGVCDDIAKSGYNQTSNLFRIQWDEPVDFPLLERIIRYNIEDKKDCTTFWRK